MPCKCCIQGSFAQGVRVVEQVQNSQYYSINHSPHQVPALEVRPGFWPLTLSDGHWGSPASALPLLDITKERTFVCWFKDERVSAVVCAWWKPRGRTSYVWAFVLAFVLQEISGSSLIMPYELQMIDPACDFPALARCLFESHESPKQDFFHVWFPIHGDGEEAREESIREAADRLATWHNEDPTSHWQKIVETDTGKVVAACFWNIYESNPYAEPDDIPVTWFPDDGSRRFAERVLEAYSAPRAQVGARPQVCKCHTQRC